ncbi:carbohydrate ABC transporter permease [Candidatus Aerophobetes bacterium]|nr:carbohydrate ABC transporter permease [Candidatus Aerophobetes bacterium]
MWNTAKARQQKPFKSIRRNSMKRMMYIISKNWVWIPTIILTIMFITPILWSLSASFKSMVEIYSARTLWDFLPKNPSLRAYGEVLAWKDFPVVFFNSTFLAISSTLVAVAASILAGYAFARYAFRWRHVLLLAILIPRILPRVSLIIPLYELMVSLGLMDSRLWLTITYSATAIPLASWVLAGFFAAIPNDLDEAATIEGASLWQILWYILIPVSWPGIVTALIMCIRESWNEFPFVLAFTTSVSARTLPYQLFLLRESVGVQDWSVVNAFTILSILPMLMVFVILQRYIVKGVTLGAIK